MIKLEIEFQADVQNRMNNRYIVTTKAKGYEDIVGEGSTIPEAINDFDEQCKQLTKCA